MADLGTGDTASRATITITITTRAGIRGGRGAGGAERHSLAFLKASRARKAAREWREEIVRWNRGRRTFKIPTEGSRPRILPGLDRAPKELASRFFQLSSGHAMISPFLREKFGWVSSELCWWCGSARQTREHLSKECVTWRQESESCGKNRGASDR